MTVGRRSVVGDDLLRFGLVLEAVAAVLGAVRGPDEEPRQLVLPLQFLGGADAEVRRDQAGDVAGLEAGEHRGARVVRRLVVVELDVQRDVGVGAVGVELEVDVVDDARVLAPPQRLVVLLHHRVLKRRDGGGDVGHARLELRQELADALHERVHVGAGREVLVVDVDAVEPVRVDDVRDRRHGVGHPRVDGGRREEDIDDVFHAVAAEPGHDGHVRVRGLDGGHGGGRQVVRVPERAEHAVGRRRRGLLVHRRVVDGEGEDEVEGQHGVDGNVGELDAVELRADVLPEQEFSSAVRTSMEEAEGTFIRVVIVRTNIRGAARVVMTQASTQTAMA
ncbi:hypothetical protein U9M48_004369 [Paspalum notatum var. saurae]|uniref:Uncharacterized protein n=1 Tax=Paspalum notatum var. saurae TaxID=547442 RepID=A0AAQ3PMH9_PASNO